MCVRFDNNIRDRIKFYESVFSKYMPTLPSFRNTRRSLTYCRIWMHLKDFQSAEATAREPHAKQFEE